MKTHISPAPASREADRPPADDTGVLVLSLGTAAVMAGNSFPGHPAAARVGNYTPTASGGPYEGLR